jgi:hypothetical protein
MGSRRGGSASDLVGMDSIGVRPITVVCGEHRVCDARPMKHRSPRGTAVSLTHSNGAGALVELGAADASMKCNAGSASLFPCFWAAETPRQIGDLVPALWTSVSLFSSQIKQRRVHQKSLIRPDNLLPLCIPSSHEPKSRRTQLVALRREVLIGLRFRPVSALLAVRRPTPRQPPAIAASAR